MNSFQSGGMGGGGFMNDVGSPGNFDSSQKKKTRSQTLLPVTGAMLHKADYNVTEDVFSYDGIPIHQVTFIGVIREVQEAATNISYKIDDQTSEMISVKKWIDQDDGPGGAAEQLKRSECREDTYVRVVGHMKSFNDGKMRSVIAFSMVPVMDFNEITFHMLDVVHANLKLSKASAGAPIQQNQMNTPSRGTGGLSDAFGSYAATDAGLTGTNKTVYDHITNCTNEQQGISIMELKRKIPNEHQLRQAIEWLSNEGHIYSTIDDDHFRSTSN